MKKKLIGILICMLLIINAVPALGNIDEIKKSEINILNHDIIDEYVPGEFIVKFTDESALSDSSIIALNEKHQVKSIEEVFKNAEKTRLDNIYVLNVPESSDILFIVENYLFNKYVVYAEPNFIGNLCLIPNDEKFDWQWSLHNTGQFGAQPDADIDAIEAWDIETGDPDIIIASIDTGVNYSHTDLVDNIWINEGEIPDNDIDDDGNGYIDDIHGWDFIDDDNKPMDHYGHGTRCASIHSFVTNNSIGGAGICWACKTMVIRSIIGTGGTQQIWIANGIKYAADNGADVLNLEYYSYYPSDIIKDAVNYAYEKGCFMCAVAANDNRSSPAYPAGFENVTAVAATNQWDERCDEDDWGTGKGSNYGQWVDVAAPGNMILIAWWLNNIVMLWEGGTSLASPHVAGLAALLLSKNPDLSPDEVKSLICENVDPYNSTEYIGTGRINAEKALKSLLYGDLHCEGNLIWENISPGSELTGSLYIENKAVNGTQLDWEIVEKPEWGDWTLNPESGDDLEFGIQQIISVNIIAPEEKNTIFTGEIKIQNKNNLDDNCTIHIEVSTPKYKSYFFNFPLLNWLFERFPNAFPILRYILLN